MDQLRERVARALSDTPGFWHPFGYEGWDALAVEDREWCLGLADAALAAVGLDDLEKAVARAASALATYGGNPQGTTSTAAALL
jgi:hypothetical protein